MAETTRSNRRLFILLAAVALMLGIVLIAALIAPALSRPSVTPTTNRPVTVIYVIPVVASLTPSPTLAPTNPPTATPIRSPTLTTTPRRIITPTSTATITNSASRPATVTRAPSQAYSTLPVPPPPSDRPAAQHADLNLNLRGYARTQAALQLLDLQGATDPGGPQLKTLFTDNLARPVRSTYRVYNWDWGCNCRSGLIDDPEVTLIGLSATPGETLFLPVGGADIMNDFRALVLYADADSITFKYTRSDTIVGGYALHVEGINVDSNLLALYQQMNSAGRGNLPALRARQPFGTAQSNEVQVAVRDNGAFMEPRSRKDWWR